MTCIIFNPTARGDKAKKLHTHLTEFARTATLRPTTGPGDARVLATEAVQAGCTTLVAAGGDGTVNEVLNGLADAPGGLARARLAVLPLGTINVFAKELGIPSDLQAAWRVVQAGRERRVDLPVAEFQLKGQPARRHFAQLAGAGLDSRAVAELDWEQKKKLGPGAYLLAGLRALKKGLPTISVELADGTTDQGQLVLIGNGRYYGGRLKVFPDAELADGRLHILVAPRISFPVLARAGAELMSGSFAQTKAARHYQTSRVRLASTAPCEFELEGDNAGMLPVTMSLTPQALRVVAP